MVVIGAQLEPTPTALPWTRSLAVSARGVRASVTLLLVAVVYAASSQGGYYPGQLRTTTVLVLAALVVSRPVRADFGVPTVAAGVLAAWYLIAGGLAHALSRTVPAIELLVALAATVAIIRRATVQEHRVLIGGLIATGCVVALVGWE